MVALVSVINLLAFGGWLLAELPGKRRSNLSPTLEHLSRHAPAAVLFITGSLSFITIVSP